MSDGFESAARLLPASLRDALCALGERDRQAAEEVRLRTGREPAVLLPEGERVFRPGRSVRAEELCSVLEAATGASMHAFGEELRRGFITGRGGVRVGVCGTAVPGGGLRSFSSLSLRIPRQIRSAGAEAIEEVLRTRASVIVVSPPGGGKTTFLRELVRAASDGGARVSLADERGEIAAVWEGEPQFDVGRRTDVMTGAPKAEGAMMLMRSMSPEIIALDEITDPEDANALCSIANCGVAIFATAHAASTEEFFSRPACRGIAECGVFERAVLIHGRGGARQYRVAEL